MVASERMPATVFQPLASIVPGRWQNSEYYVTYSSSFSHENPRRLLYLIEPTRFCNICFFPCRVFPTPRGLFSENEILIVSREKRETCFPSTFFPTMADRDFNPLPSKDRTFFFFPQMYPLLLLGRKKKKIQGKKENARNFKFYQIVKM